MFLCGIVGQLNEENKIFTRRGIAFSVEKFKAIVKSCGKLNHLEEFHILWNDGKTLKEAKMLDYINNSYSFDGIGKIIKEVVR